MVPTETIGGSLANKNFLRYGAMITEGSLLLRNNSWDYQISLDGCPYRIRFLSTTLEYTRAYNR